MRYIIYIFASRLPCLTRPPASAFHRLQAAATAGFGDGSAAAPCFSRCASGEIPAVHAEEQLSSSDWPSLVDTAAPGAGLPLLGAWLKRHTAESTPAPAASHTTTPAAPAASQHLDCSADAEDVQPRPVARYVSPARRACASTTILSGCRLVQSRPAAPAPTPKPAPFVPPQRRTPAQQTAAQEAGRPGKLCAWPLLTAGPCTAPCSAAAEAPRPAYLIALRGC